MSQRGPFFPQRFPQPSVGVTAAERQTAPRGGSRAAAVPRRCAILHGKACRHAHDALGDEGDPALRRLSGVGQVIERRAESGCNAANGPEQQAGKAAHDVGQRKRGSPADGDGHGDAKIVADKDQSAHHAERRQLIDIFLFDGKHFLLLRCTHHSNKTSSLL